MKNYKFWFWANVVCAVVNVVSGSYILAGLNAGVAVVLWENR